MPQPREVRIRHAEGPDDLGRVQELMRGYGQYLAGHSAVAAQFCFSDYEKEMAALPGPYVAPGTLLLALVDGEAAGCVALRKAGKQGAPLCSKSLELKRLWVQPRFRGLSLGRRLMNEAIAHAQAVGAETILLDTVPTAMPEANRLYADLGFEPVERYNDNPIDGVQYFRLQIIAARDALPAKI